MNRLLVLAFVACGSHDEPAPAPAPAHAPAPKPPSAPDPWANPRTEAARRADRLCPEITNPYFFSVEKAHQVSYVLGTRHISVALAKFPEIVRARLRASRLVVFEVAPDDNHHAKQTEVVLAKMLPPADWAHYQDLVGEELQVASPAAALLVMTALYEDFPTQLEKDIERAASAAHIPMRGLETALFQDDLLEKLLDLRMLRAAIEQTKTREEIDHDSAEDLADYCKGTDDSPGIDGKTRDDMVKAGYTQQELDALDDQIVYKRNASWIPSLESLFAQGGVFVAVGADHLLGPKGVIARLAADGYTTRRIGK